MHLLRNTSIRKRLTLIIMGISCISVLITTLAISIIGVYSLRTSIVAELGLTATLVGDRNKAILNFGTPEQAIANLSFLDVKPSVVQACLYTGDGKPFASYVSEKYLDKTSCPLSPEMFTRSPSRIQITQPIKGDFGDIGFVYLESTLEQIEDYIEKQSKIALTVACAAFLLSYLLAINLQKAISQPILGLTAVAREVARNKDYSIRAPEMGDPDTQANNELIILTHSFNNMLKEIDARNMQLSEQNAELVRARDVAEGANRAKSQFLANISHELRTPLNAIIGFSSILMNQLFGPLGDNKYLEYSKDINESGAHLLDIINDILDLSKAEAGKLSLAYEEIHVAKAIQKCMTILAERAEKNNVTISADIPKYLPPLVVDRLRFIQIILNILSNAVKFTNPGGNIVTKVALKDVGGAVTDFVITITDSGIGMSQDDIDKAFQSFGQVDSGLNRKYEGTGLGLPLTKKLIDLHNGSIEIDSKIGQGTTVSLTFPAVTLEAIARQDVS